MLRGKSHKQKPILENILLSNSILRLIKLNYNHRTYFVPFYQDTQNMYSPKLSYLYTWYPDQTIAPFRCTKNILHGRSLRWDNLDSMCISKQSLRETSRILESRCEWNVELPGDPDNKLKYQKYGLVKSNHNLVFIVLHMNFTYLWV